MQTKYVALHNVGKPRKDGILPGTWKEGDVIDAEEIGEYAQSLLRRGMIKLHDSHPGMPDNSERTQLIQNLNEQQTQSNELSSRLSERDKTIAGLQRQLDSAKKTI